MDDTTLGRISSATLAFESRLHKAARDGDLATVKACAEDCEDMDAHEPIYGVRFGEIAGRQGRRRGDKEQWTALHIAAENARVDVLRYLIEQQVDINARDKDDETPLHCAAFWGHLEIAGWLLAAGAMLDAHNKYHWTPYDVAVRRGNDEVAQLLLEEQRHKALYGLA